MRNTYTIGTRGSRLALWQAYEAKRCIEQATGVSIEIKVISTRGDERLDIALHSNTLSKGLFTQELEEELHNHTVDFAVHSLKDLPVEMDERLCLAAVLERADPRDVVIANERIEALRDLAGKRIGTSSPRRIAQLKYALGEEDNSTKYLPIRGNVETRIAKLRNGEYDAIIMAAAGIKRLDLEHEVSLYIDPETVSPAPGQAAVAIQCAVSNSEACKIARCVDHRATHEATHLERRLLSMLGGGCAVPFGCLVHEDDGVVRGTSFFTNDCGKGVRYGFTYPAPITESNLDEIISNLKGV